LTKFENSFSDRLADWQFGMAQMRIKYDAFGS